MQEGGLINKSSTTGMKSWVEWGGAGIEAERERGCRIWFIRLHRKRRGAGG